MNPMRRWPREPDEGSNSIGLALGVLGSLALSVAMLPLRGHLHNDNIALALVVPVLIAGVIGGRWAGALSAITAALCFDFFFTQPYLSLRIASSNDITSGVVLVIVALISAEVGIARRARSCRPCVPLRSRSPLSRSWSSPCATVRSKMSCRRCGRSSSGSSVSPTPRTSPARRSRRSPVWACGGRSKVDRSIATHTDFLLPPGGIELPSRPDGRVFGRLVLFTSEPGAGIPAEATGRGHDRRRARAHARDEGVSDEGVS